jgi:hypothetical protein
MAVGSMTLGFSDAANGTFTAAAEGATVTKPITREAFASRPPSAARA